MRHDNNALLAGVCSRLATMFQWNVWVVRGLFVLMLALKTLPALIAYAALAVLFHYLDRQKTSAAGSDHQDGAEHRPYTQAAHCRAGRQAHKHNDADQHAYAELAARQRRINELERRFRAWEESL